MGGVGRGTDLRMFIRGFRKVGEHRLLMGSGSCQNEFDRGYPDSARLNVDAVAASRWPRPVRALSSFFPEIANSKIKRRGAGQSTSVPARYRFPRQLGNGKFIFAAVIPVTVSRQHESAESA